MTQDQILAIIRKHKEECEEAQEKYDSLPEMHHIPLQTVQRKQYAIDAQITLLQTILDEIEKEEVTS